MKQETDNTRVYVWDPLVRFFHWTLVLAFVIAYLTGDEESTVHAYAGYYILGLITFRGVWGLIGPRPARFSDFIAPPAAVIDYLKGFIGQGSGKQYMGHNPAGGWMVIALLISLLATGISGLQVYGLQGHGPLAQVKTVPPSDWIITTVMASEREDDEDEEKSEDDNPLEEFWEEIHEFLAELTVLLIVLHITGVIASSIKGRQNLAKAMITGYKIKRK